MSINVLPRSTEIFLFASDVTPAVRAYAKTLEDKSIIYSPNPAPGNKPIAVGHTYSVLACLPEKTPASPFPWVVPLSVDRVSTCEKGHEVGPQKLCELMKDTSLPFNDSLCVHVADTAYFTLPIRQMNATVDHLMNLKDMNIRSISIRLLSLMRKLKRSYLSAPCG